MYIINNYKILYYISATKLSLNIGVAGNSFNIWTDLYYMINAQKITLVFPCRNEGQGIAKLIKSVPSQIDEIIVVDNKSTDNTVDQAKKAGAKVFVEKRSHKGIGYGYALATGINNATGDLVVCMDADGSYPIHKIVEVVKYAQKNKLNFISCNRLPILNPKEMSVIRRFGVWVLNTTVRICYGYPIQDSLTGMWVFDKFAARNLHLFEGGWDFSLEIKLQAIHNKDISFTEYHIPYHDRIFDQSKQNLFKTGFDHFIYLLKKRVEMYNILVLRQNKISIVETD